MTVSPSYAAHTSTAMLVLFIDIHNIIIILLFRTEEPLYERLSESIYHTPIVTERPVTTMSPTIVTTEFTEMQQLEFKPQEYSNINTLTEQYEN